MASEKFNTLRIKELLHMFHFSKGQRDAMPEVMASFWVPGMDILNVRTDTDTVIIAFSFKSRVLVGACLFNRRCLHLENGLLRE